MIPHQVGKVNVHYDITIGQNDIFFVRFIQICLAGEQRIDLRPVAGGLGAGVGEGGEDFQAAVLAVEIPVLAGADVVDQRTVVLFGEDADVVDPRLNQRGEDKVNEAVTAGERDGRQGAVGRQLVCHSGIAFREKQAESFRNHLDTSR